MILLITWLMKLHGTLICWVVTFTMYAARGHWSNGDSTVNVPFRRLGFCFISYRVTGRCQGELSEVPSSNILQCLWLQSFELGLSGELQQWIKQEKRAFWCEEVDWCSPCCRFYAAQVTAPLIFCDGKPVIWCLQWGGSFDTFLTLAVNNVHRSHCIRILLQAWLFVMTGVKILPCSWSTLKHYNLHVSSELYSRGTLFEQTTIKSKDKHK